MSSSPRLAQRFDVGVPFCTARVGLGDRAQSYKDSDLVLLSRTHPFPAANQTAEPATAAGEDEADDADMDDMDDTPPGFEPADPPRDAPEAGNGAADVAGDHESNVYALALVEAKTDTLVRLRLCLPTSSSERADRVRASCAGGGSSPGWHCTRLCNLATIQREWVALHAAARLPFADVVFSGTHRVGAGATAAAMKRWRCPSRLMDELSTRFNGTQLEAIQAGLSSCPLVLIQGPPGTGKTATLQGLLSLLMHAQPLLDGSGGFDAVPSGIGANGSKARDHVDSAGTRVNDPMTRTRLWHAACPWLQESRGGGALAADTQAVYGPMGPPPKPAVPLGGGARGRQPHVLVCAPSNSALDEIVSRLMRDGLLDGDGRPYAPSLVRVGVRPHPSVKSVTMDALVQQRLGAQTAGADAAAGTLVTPGRLERDRCRLAILEECSVVASTLSFAGSGLFSRFGGTFDVVVIDEAAQAVEPSVLVPLIHGCKQLFLVGDPVQLPATVLSPAAKDMGFDTSLFSRLQRAGHTVHVLRTQYRMHPDIRAFPSSEFYAEALEDGPDVAALSTRHWHGTHSALGPFTFWDVPGCEVLPSGSRSFVNETEADFVVALAAAFLAAAPELIARNDGLAVVTPYKAQAELIRRRLAATMGDAIASRLDVNTVDGFQGREREVVIFSVVRSPALSASEQKAAEKAASAGRRFLRNKEARLGFVEDERRMNVGLTRARASLAVVGRADALTSGGGHWGSLVQDAYARGRFVRAVKPYADCIARLKDVPADHPLQPPSDDEDEEDGQDGRKDGKGLGRKGGRSAAKFDPSLDDIHPDELSGEEEDYDADVAAAQRPSSRGAAARKGRAAALPAPAAAATTAGAAPKGKVMWKKRPAAEDANTADAAGEHTAQQPEQTIAVAAEPPQATTTTTGRPKRTRAA